ncbi:MAG: hypothetical protein JO368_04680 [Acidimicrobiales bacterium]|nr:hypothetical protein [Acidimicrobiales bacterium]
MTAHSASPARADDTGSPLLGILLAMAMFVLVVDTSLMNVSISAVVHDLHTTAVTPRVKDEIIRINTQARHRALQVALLVPLLAGLGGFLNAFRMVKLPHVAASAAAEGMVLG